MDTLLGQLREQLVAAGATQDVNAIELAAEQLLEAREREGVAVGEALEDDTGKDGLVAGNVRDGGPAPPPELISESSSSGSASTSMTPGKLDWAAWAMRSSMFQTRPSAFQDSMHCFSSHMPFTREWKQRPAPAAPRLVYRASNAALVVTGWAMSVPTRDQVPEQMYKVESRLEQIPAMAEAVS